MQVKALEDVWVSQWAEYMSTTHRVPDLNLLGTTSTGLCMPVIPATRGGGRSIIMSSRPANSVLKRGKKVPQPAGVQRRPRRG